MARKRILDIHQLLFNTGLVDALGPRGLLVYECLWSIAEDWGGYKARYQDIALETGALRCSAAAVEEFIKILIDRGNIVPYKDEQGEEVHWIRDFLDSQTLKNPAVPKLSLPEWIEFEVHTYKSGRVYAKYTILQSGVPARAASSGAPKAAPKEEKADKSPVDPADKKPPAKKKSAVKKEKYGKFSNVLLGEKEHESLVAKFGNCGAAERINELSVGVESKGYKYKSHFAAILQWELRRIKDEGGNKDGGQVKPEDGKYGGVTG